MSQSTVEKAKFRGAWEGSDVTDRHIEVLRHRRMLPPAERVKVRLPDAQGSPTARDGKVVVFKEHFFRGFGLPASEFFSQFLVFFGLQPHHLAPNAFLQLAAYISLCEGFIGIKPRLDFWRKLFIFKQQSAPTNDPDIMLPPWSIIGPTPASRSFLSMIR
ncbi:retrotransposon ty3-gypsy subclass [Hordeum vulgare]|nr:retrotransposon ty3-gypsy subclass [Hordeum vulgare]